MRLVQGGRTRVPNFPTSRGATANTVRAHNDEE